MSSAAGPQVFVDVGATTVSPGGAFQFNPTTINVANGTDVIFRFSGIPGNHSVTQSSFAEPCTPLLGGVDSGFIPATTNENLLSEWSFTLFNDQKPLWFFCRQLVPVSHCNAGMVFAVNPPKPGSANDFDAFLAAAKAAPTGQLTANPPSPSATSPPASNASAQAARTKAVGNTRLSNVTGFGSTSFTRTSSATSTPSTTATSRPAGKPLPVGAIAGSIVGALVLLGLLCVAAIFIFRRRASRRSNRPRSLRHKSVLLEVADENGADTRPDPLIIYEKRGQSQVEQESGAGGSSSTSHSGSTSASTALPTAEELAVANMALAEEMRFLRGQVQRLESDRNSSGAWIEEDKPPEYGTR